MADFDDFFDAPIDVNSPKIATGAEGASTRHTSPGSTPPSARKSKEDRYHSGASESDASYTDFSDESDSDEGNTKQKIEAKVPSVGTYSDESEDESPRATTLKSESSVKVKHRQDDSPLRNRKDSFSAGSDYTLSDTDSDVTDVSPLHSPHLSPKMKPGMNYNKRPPRSPANKKDRMAHHNEDILLQGGNEKMDLNILMQAVLEMEKKREHQYLKDERIAKSRRVLFEPTKAKPQSRKNFSFSNDKVSTIDKENQRLMEKIVKMAVEGKKKQRPVQKKKTVPAKMTPSAVNRLRDQRRIEQENLALLKRLQGTRASNVTKRELLLKDYEKKTIAGQSVAAAHDFKSPSPYGIHMLSAGKRSQSMSHVESSASVVLQDRGYHYRARPSSAVTYITGETGEKANVVLQSKGLSRPTSASTTHSFGTKGTRPTSGKQRPGSAHSGHYKKQSSTNSNPDWDTAW